MVNSCPHAAHSIRGTHLPYSWRSGPSAALCLSCPPPPPARGRRQPALYFCELRCFGLHVSVRSLSVCLCPPDLFHHSVAPSRSIYILANSGTSSFSWLNNIPPRGQAVLYAGGCPVHRGMFMASLAFTHECQESPDQLWPPKMSPDVTQCPLGGGSVTPGRALCPRDT